MFPEEKEPMPVVKEIENKCLLCERNTRFRLVEESKGYLIYACPLCGGQFVSPMKAPDYNLLYKEEIGGFSYKKHTSLSPERYLALFSSASYLVRIKIVLSLLKKYNIQGKLLDIGSSQGVFCRLVSDTAGLEVFAIDPSDEAIKFAREKFHIKNAFTCSIRAIPRFLSDFDVITALEVIEHIEEPNFLLNKAFELLKPGGYLILSTPNNENVGVMMGRREAGDYPPHHLSRYCRKTLRYMLNHSGFDCVDILNIPIDRHIIGHILAPKIIEQLALGKDELSIIHTKPNKIIRWLIGLPFFLRASQLLGDAAAFFLDHIFPHRGATLIAVARKPYVS